MNVASATGWSIYRIMKDEGIPNDRRSKRDQIGLVSLELRHFFVIRHSSFRLVDQLGKLLEKIRSIVRSGCSLGVILPTEDRQFFVSHPFDGAVVEIDVRDFDFLRQGIRIDRKPVILRGDRYSAAA